MSPTENPEGDDRRAAHGDALLDPVDTDPGATPARIERRLEVAVDHPAFAGHFPGQPILPGVLLVAEILEAVRSVPSLRTRVGDAPRLVVVKFIRPALPGASLLIALTPGRTGVDVEVREGDRLAASGRIAFSDPAASA